MDDPLPQFAWRLSAPESLVLLWGPDTGDAWALKVGLLELVVRQALVLKAVDRRRVLRPARRVNVLALGEPLESSATRALRIIIETYPMASGRTDDVNGIPVDRLAHAVFARHFRQVRTGFLRRRWERSGGGYVSTEVLPDLEQRGLYEREAALFGSKTWTLTANGAKELERLRRFMAAGRESFGTWVEHQPDLAKEYVERAGTSILLLGGVAPLLRRLQERTAKNGDDWRIQRSPGMPPPSGSSRLLTAAALAGVFGPGALDDLDAAFFALSGGVDQAWQSVHDGGAGVAAGGGE